MLAATCCGIAVRPYRRSTPRVGCCTAQQSLHCCDARPSRAHVNEHGSNGDFVIMHRLRFALFLIAAAIAVPLTSWLAPPAPAWAQSPVAPSSEQAREAEAAAAWQA